MDKMIKVVCCGIGLYVLYKAYFFFFKIIFNTFKIGFFEIFSDDSCNVDEANYENTYSKTQKNTLPRRTRYCENDIYDEELK